MEKLSMCRICLVKDVRLRSIVETHLQEMYESLVLIPFETKDHRPILVCYICCARLENCYELRKSCLRSEELFTQMLSNDELQPVELQQNDNKKKLTVHNVAHFSVGHVLQMNADNVGAETLTFGDVKIEKCDPEDIEEDTLQESSVYDNMQYADSDDDPLINVKKEQLGHRKSDSISKESQQAAQTNPEHLTTRDLKVHKLVQDIFKKLKRNIFKNDKTPAKSTSKVTFTLNDNNKERSTSVPHSERVQYTCDTCQQCYSSKWKLERHIRLCFEAWRKTLPHELHQCHVCKKSFPNTSHLTRHIRTHTGEKPYYCDICKKRFSEKNTVTKHMLIHTGEKPFQCYICKKQFSQKKTLTDHMHTHTGERPYHCDICKKQFIQKISLTNHMRTHTGEKPYQCYICKKQFSEKYTLRDHMRTHTGEKPYQCYKCKKQFAHRKTLIDHMHTHTGEKPYHCDICKKQFALKYYIARHMRTHVGDKPRRRNVLRSLKRSEIVS